MPRKRKLDRKNARECKGKRKFTTRKEARAHRQWLNREYLATGLGTYRCTVCGAWHVGHNKRRNKRKR